MGDAEVDGEALEVRDCCLVPQDGVAKALAEEQIGLCLDIVSWEEGARTIPVIPIVVVGDRLLIALPGPVWHRSPAKRLLPPGSLVKPVLASVAGVLPGGDLSSASPGVEIKVWVAFASPQLESEFRQAAETDNFDPGFVGPAGQACAPLMPHGRPGCFGRRSLFLPDGRVRGSQATGRARHRRQVRSTGQGARILSGGN